MSQKLVYEAVFLIKMLVHEIAAVNLSKNYLLKNECFSVFKHWVRACCTNWLLVSCNTNNGIEHQNNTLKHSYFQQPKTNSLTSILTSIRVSLLRLSLGQIWKVIFFSLFDLSCSSICVVPWKKAVEKFFLSINNAVILVKGIQWYTVMVVICKNNF